MKVLTLVSVLVLPASALAGIMGMNFKGVGLFQHAAYFWVAVAAMILIAAVTLVVSRVRRWI
jgi:Mg2+ and Co2+ transporter CorA